MKLDAVNRAGGAPFTANPHEPAGGRFAFKLIAAGALCTSAGGQLGTPTERRKIKESWLGGPGWLCQRRLHGASHDDRFRRQSASVFIAAGAVWTGAGRRFDHSKHAAGRKRCGKESWLGKTWLTLSTAPRWRLPR